MSLTEQCNSHQGFCDINTIEYLETTRNVDNMLMQFQKDREYVVYLMENDMDLLISTLWSTSSPVCIDEKCLFNMGQTSKTYSLEDRINGKAVLNDNVVNFYLCPQCKNMRRLVDSAKTAMGQPFYIEHGTSAGQQLIITETNLSKLFFIKESPPAAVSRALKNPHITKLEQCSSGCSGGGTCRILDYRSMDYVGSDAFTNNLLVNWFLNDKLTNLGIPNLLSMHIGFVCNSKGYALYEHPDIGRIRHLQEYPEFLDHTGKPSPTAKADEKVPLSKDTTKGVIMQLFAVLHALRQYDFSHGGPSSRSVLFKKEPCSYLYDGVHVEGPLTLKLCDLYHSGITVGEKRFYNKSVIADEELLTKPFRPIIDTVTITPFSFDKSADCSPITVYRLKDPVNHLQESILFMYIKHLGLPLYQSSFDAYGYMISLMSDRSFYATVMSDESMYLLWRSMWLPEEFERIQESMHKLHKSPDPVTRVTKVFKVLAGFGLRCDMIEHGWNMIKTW